MVRRVSDGVWLVTGVQASGKSTVADLLARQFERAVHVRGGQFYNIYGPDVIGWLRSVSARPRHLVVLRPSVSVVWQREHQRHEAIGKTAYRPGEFTVEELDGFLAQTPQIGLWLDTSAQTAIQTVAEIMRRRAEALVDEALARSGQVAT